MKQSKIEQKIIEMQQQINELTDLCEDYNNENKKIKESIFNIMNAISNNQDTLIQYGESIIYIQKIINGATK